ncbi:MAG TPA: TorF family putative porin [Steroidobacteraceae bacterium]|nr:TorF family putative porin [Steroidobacteraceae bacterium]
MKLSHGLAAVGLTFAAMTAQAEVTGTIGAVSDYDFRGVSLSAKDPALQGSIDYAHDSGFYAGVWGSNIDYGDDVDGDLEVDVYAGFANQINDDLGYDVGLVYYTYPGADDIDDYPELYAGLTYKWLEVKQWYTNDNSGSDLDSFYTEANAEFELPANFTLGLHAGYNYGDYFEDFEYVDYSIGVGYTLGHFDLGLKYVDNDMDDQIESDVFNSEGRAIFSISTTFPWSAE